MTPYSTCFDLVLDKMAEITYFLDVTLFFSIPRFLCALSVQLGAQTTVCLWGRNGFDGDKEA